MVKYTFQYFSDIHLEFYNDNRNLIKRLFDIKETKADFLLLPGDIGQPFKPSYTHFLGMMSPHFTKIFVIPGNHEYYKSTMSTSEVDHLCRQVCLTLPQQNVVFLQDEEFNVCHELSIYGTTLWSYINDNIASTIENAINDYKCIHKFTPSVSNHLHHTSVKKLNDYIANTNMDQKVIVMTHHMPSFDLIDASYKTQTYTAINCAFASDLPIRHDKRIVAWVYGHTHKPRAYGKFYCNPIGYPGENKSWSLNTTFEVTI